MPFQFKTSEPLAKAVRRVFAERVDVACARLGQSRRPKAIHQARKEIKKLRSVIRLVQAGLPLKPYRKICKSLRRAAGLLAAVRDAQVTFQALSQLAPNPQRTFPHFHERLRKEWKGEMKRWVKQKTFAGVAHDLNKAQRKMRRVVINGLDVRALASALRRSHERGRARFLRISREPTAKNFHSWRKLAKTQWYQLGLLPPPRTQALRRRLSDLERLGELLGEEHDLCLLAGFLVGVPPENIQETRLLNRLIVRRRNQLRAAAMKLGTRLYAKAPECGCEIGPWR